MTIAEQSYLTASVEFDGEEYNVQFIMYKGPTISVTFESDIEAKIFTRIMEEKYLNALRAVQMYALESLNND